MTIPTVDVTLSTHEANIFFFFWFISGSCMLSGHMSQSYKSASLYIADTGTVKFRKIMSSKNALDLVTVLRNEQCSHG